MLRETTPSDLQFEDVTLFGNSDSPVPGKAAFKRWSGQESFRRGFRIAVKAVGALLLVILPLAMLEPFLFMIWGSIVVIGLFMLVGPLLHLKYWNERTSFFYVESQCPHCGTSGKLTPFLKTEFTEKFTVLCPGCGQTSTVMRTRSTLP